MKLCLFFFVVTFVIIADRIQDAAGEPYNDIKVAIEPEFQGILLPHEEDGQDIEKKADCCKCCAKR